MTTYYSLQYNHRKENGDSSVDINVSFENPGSRAEVAEKINTWLEAIGYSEYKVVLST